MASNPKRDRILSVGLGIGVVLAGGVLAYQHGFIEPALVESLTGGMITLSSEGGGGAQPGAPIDPTKSGNPGNPGKSGENTAATKPGAKPAKATGQGLAAKVGTGSIADGEGEGAAAEGASQSLPGADTQAGNDGEDPADALLMPSTEAKSVVEDLAVPQALSEIEGWRLEGKAPDASRLRRFLTHKKAWVALTAFAWAVETKALPDAELATTGRGFKERHPTPLLRRVLKRFAARPEVVAAMRAHLGL